MKNSYTVFGQGFVGLNVTKYLRKKKYNVFLPKKGKYIFKKNLSNIIYCIGNDNWLNDPKGSFDANASLVPKIIFNNKFESFTLISSTRVYLANTSKNTNEKSYIKLNPNYKNFFYNSLKLSAESLCLTLKSKKIKVVRMSNLFGSNFTNQIYLLPNLIRNSITKKKIDIFVSKKSSKDFLHVNEAIELMLKIIKKGRHRLYNVASGKNIRLSKISEKIRKITNCKINYKNQNKLVKEPKIDISRIKKEFNFSPKINLINSLEQIIVNYKKYE